MNIFSSILSGKQIVAPFLALALVGCLSGCASGDKTPAEPVEASLSAADPASSAPVSASAQVMPTSEDAAFEDYGSNDTAEKISDPLEGWNRMWFSFNDFFLLEMLKPVYTGYTYVMPEVFRTGLSNFLHNLGMPIRVVNSLLQGRFGQAGYEFDRFLINSTVGFAGLIDVAKQSKPLVEVSPYDADFGQTLGVWGVGEGFYLVWPFVGPSTIRDTVGLAGDYAASPFFLLTDPVGPVPMWPAIGADLGLRFNDMGSAIDAYESLTRSAIEPYIGARDAYIKYRRNVVGTTK